MENRISFETISREGILFRRLSTKCPVASILLSLTGEQLRHAAILSRPFCLEKERFSPLFHREKKSHLPLDRNLLPVTSARVFFSVRIFFSMVLSSTPYALLCLSRFFVIVSSSFFVIIFCILLIVLSYYYQLGFCIPLIRITLLLQLLSARTFHSFCCVLRSLFFLSTINLLNISLTKLSELYFYFL